MEHTRKRLMKSFYHLWQVLEDLRLSPDPDALLSEWRQAERPSKEWRQAQEYEHAIRILSVVMRLDPEETEKRVWEHVTESP